MKYFRFLFEEINGCFMHFVELTESDAEERMRILYLKSMENKEDLKKDSECFACPTHVDLVVLGQNDLRTRETWKRLSEHTEADLLVLAGEDSGEDLKAGEIIQLSESKPFWCWRKRDWNTFLKTYENGSVVMMHGLDSGGEDRRLIEDCVMSVKATNQCRRCHGSRQPDGYGCALGCVLHQDYDLCKYQGEGQQMGQLTGTVLLAGVTNGDSIRQFQADLEQQPWKMRFLALPKENQKTEISGNCEIWNLPADNEHKTYYISMEAEMEAVFAKQICEKGYYHIPVVLREEQGICCSGLMKYQEK